MIPGACLSMMAVMGPCQPGPDESPESASEIRGIVNRPLIQKCLAHADKPVTSAGPGRPEKKKRPDTEGTFAPLIALAYIRTEEEKGNLVSV